MRVQSLLAARARRAARTLAIAVLGWALVAVPGGRPGIAADDPSTAPEPARSDMDRLVEASRLLVEQAAGKYDRGERCDMEAGMAKLFASESALSNATEAMRVHGGYGYSEEFDIERYYRDAPLMCIGEGTNEIQRVLIAKQLVKRNPA